MSIRTIQAPGVEIKEIDKSAYSPSMTGTRCFVMGYSNKGEPYQPMEFTSRSSFENYYGTPDNEAERYFHTAAMEVINQNGVLYTARIPYDNESKDVMTGIRYEVKDPVNSTLDMILPNIASSDTSISNFKLIEPSEVPVTTYDLSAIDEYRTKESKVANGSFIIIDKTCATLNKIVEDDRKGDERELIGLVPVVTTAANALYTQKLIGEVALSNIHDYEVIANCKTLSGYSLRAKDISRRFCTCPESEMTSMTCDWDEVVEGDIDTNTVSLEANSFFPAITMNSDNSGFDRTNLKKIGVVVYKAYLDASEGNKISLMPVESFAGSLGKNDKDPNTGASTFIDDIINTNSDYIYFFSNIRDNDIKDIDIYVANHCSTCGMLGFTEAMTEEKISVKSIYDGMNKCFDKVADINERDIDIVPDAGLANIASFIKNNYDEGSGPYDFNQQVEGSDDTVYKGWSKAMDSNSSAIKTWKTVEQKFDNFCKNVRKDCVFIADAPRPMVLQGEKKIVRPSKPTNSIDANILPRIKWITGLNTNYGAGYLDWFQVADEFSGDFFWCPPSIKAMGVYINTDLNFNYWDAPAGLNRGVVPAVDVAFSPTPKQAGSIYEKNWNYAINYPQDGIVLEGQKTFQVKPSAFDRVNVRRLFLRLERQTYKVARYFVYEGNTAYTRQRLVDMLNPIFQSAKVGGGIYDFKIICDESNNTPNVIDNNELRVKIGIKPVKSAEFILIDFIALSTGGSFSEM